MLGRLGHGEGPGNGPPRRWTASIYSWKAKSRPEMEEAAIAGGGRGGPAQGEPEGTALRKHCFFKERGMLGWLNQLGV